MRLYIPIALLIGCIVGFVLAGPYTKDKRERALANNMQRSVAEQQNASQDVLAAKSEEGRKRLEVANAVAEAHAQQEYTDAMKQNYHKTMDAAKQANLKLINETISSMRSLITNKQQAIASLEVEQREIQRILCKCTQQLYKSDHMNVDADIDLQVSKTRASRMLSDVASNIAIEQGKLNAMRDAAAIMVNNLDLFDAKGEPKTQEQRDLQVKRYNAAFKTFNDNNSPRRASFEP